MKKEILILGEYSSGKTALINMLLSYSVLPEKVYSTNMPVIKISGNKPMGLSIQNKEGSTDIEKWSSIPEDWNSFDYLNYNIPDHPLLKKELILWDTPGINSTNVYHQKHLSHFLKRNPKHYRLVFYIIPDKITNTSIDFLKKNKSLWDKMMIIVNVKDLKTSEEIKQIERDIRKTVTRELGTIPVQIFAFRKICEALNEKHQREQIVFNNVNWEQTIDEFEEVIKIHIDDLIGEELFETVKDIADEEVEIISDYSALNEEKLNELAELGDSAASLEYGLKLIKHNRADKAIKYLLNSSEMDNPRASNALGVCYEEGIGVEPNNHLAFQYFKKANDGGYSKATMNLALCYFRGVGVEIDRKMAFDLFKDAAQKGDTDSTYFLGICYLFGHGIQADSRVAFEMFKKNALAGNNNSKYQLAILYKNDPNFYQDSNTITNLLEETTHHKIPESLYELGKMYMEGELVPKNEAKGISLIKSAAELDLPEANHQLGILYLYGNGINKNLQLARNHFESSVRNGYRDAHYDLVVCKIEDTNDVVIKTDGLKELEKLANENNPYAQYQLGIYCLTGEVRQRNEREAFEYFIASARNGLAVAQYCLSICLSAGIGVQMSESEAFKWCQIAALNGSSDALKHINSFHHLLAGEDHYQGVIEELEKGIDNNFKEVITRIISAIKEEYNSWGDEIKKKIDLNEYEDQEVRMLENDEYALKIKTKIFSLNELPKKYSEGQNSNKYSGYFKCLLDQLEKELATTLEITRKYKVNALSKYLENKAQIIINKIDSPASPFSICETKKYDALFRIELEKFLKDNQKSRSRIWLNLSDLINSSGTYKSYKNKAIQMFETWFQNDDDFLIFARLTNDRPNKITTTEFEKISIKVVESNPKFKEFNSDNTVYIIFYVLASLSLGIAILNLFTDELKVTIDFTTSFITFLLSLILSLIAGYIQITTLKDNFEEALNWAQMCFNSTLSSIRKSTTDAFVRQAKVK